MSSDRSDSLDDGVHIIAEAGTNHNGNIETAFRLIDVAVEAGADSVKFQIIYPEELYVPRFYVDGQYLENDVFAKRKAAMLSDTAYRKLATYARDQGIGLSASVFDERGLNLLEGLAPPYIKIASCDLNNSRLLQQAASLGRTLVVSTGMATLGDIERAVNDLRLAGNRSVVLMHCVSVYPAPTERMNLPFIRTLRERFGLPVGLSDHTQSSVAAVVAMGMGVSWVEKHITLDRATEGFDHAYAAEPRDFRTYVRDIRAAEAACQAQFNKVGQEETDVKRRARRGIYAAHDIKAGHVLSSDDLLVVRPEGPLSPNDLDLIIGRRTTERIRQFQPLLWSVIGDS